MSEIAPKANIRQVRARITSHASRPVRYTEATPNSLYSHCASLRTEIMSIGNRVGRPRMCCVKLHAGGLTGEHGRGRYAGLARAKSDIHCLTRRCKWTMREASDPLRFGAPRQYK